MSARPPLPAGIARLLDAEAMRATDRWAIEQVGIPGPALMDAAGRALADAVVDGGPAGPVVIVCGAGNNGGDGYVAAERLRRAGREVLVASTVEPDRLRGDAAAARDAFGGSVRPWDPALLEGAVVVVDAILGTGATGAPRGTAGAAIAAIADRCGGAPAEAEDGRGAAAERASARVGPRPFVVACDLPSGVDAGTGEAPGPVVPADVTVTFHVACPGLWIAPGKQHAGRVRVADIGIPARAADIGPAAWSGLLTDGLLGALPSRGRGGTKFRSGHVVVVGGSPGMSGAPCLTARGAMRAGAGYVTLAVPETIDPVVTARAPVEALGAALPAGPDGGIAETAADPIVALLGAHGGTLVIGPGLGRGAARDGLLRALAKRVHGPLVVDADALAAVAGEPEALRPADGRTRATVLTPHAGELARLLGVETTAVTAQRLAHARQAAERTAAVVVLKGDDTLVVAPDGRVAISPGDAPGLATAGTGDVLSGVVAALLARGIDPFTAAAAAVWLHVRAGRLAAGTHGVDGVVAGDVAEAIGRARRSAGPPDQ